MSLDPIIGGGAGGERFGPGGVGGVDSATGTGGAGSDALSTGAGGGGGGGAGAYVGGAGGAGATQRGNGGMGGAGGVHGYFGADLPAFAAAPVRGTNGAAGQVGAVGSGSGGGGGGGYGAVLTGAKDFGTLSVDLLAGNGGNGGDSDFGGDYGAATGDPGGGGRGGIGLYFDSSAAKSVAIAASIAGGNGGAGGGGLVGRSAGGDGGEGILGENLSISVVQGGAIAGGHGGAGASIRTSAGDAGDGGAGIRGENLVIRASGGTITGGNGGSGGEGSWLVAGGHGGAGISGEDLSIAITNGATVTGGDGGEGTSLGLGGGFGGEGGAGILSKNLAIAEDIAITIASGGAVFGGTGGTGGRGYYGGRGTGGNGGAGISGENLAIAVETNGSVTGGDGGTGGSNALETPGKGGHGGAGISGEALAIAVVSGGAVTGGNGGTGGAGDSGSSATSGAGGDGGAGISGENLSITIASGGSVTGGDGGAGGAGASTGAAGDGGVGISGANLAITLGALGAISGGKGGGGVQADAIVFESGINTLDFQGGTISGKVIANGTDDTFRLSGTTGGSFDVSLIGSQFQGFEKLGSAGTATWTLTGTNSSALGWTISSGAIVIAAQMSNTAFTVGSDPTLGGATLSGLGDIGAVTVQSGGRIGPGTLSGGIGLLTTKNFVLSNGGTLDIELGGTTAGTQYDQIKVTGSVTLSGMLDFSALSSFLSASGDSFKIIDNDGNDAVIGTFNGLAQGAILTSGDRDFQISYTGGDGNDVVLKTVFLPPTLAVNAAAVAEGETVVITDAELRTTAAHVPATGLVYTLTSTSPNGKLYRDGTELGRNDTFTQDDIDKGLITYRHDGGETSEDSFGFDVSDGQGNTITGRSLSINVSAVNDDPTITGLDGDIVVFTEDGGPVLLDAGADVSLTDPDSGDFDGGTVTVSISANLVSSEDRLVIVDQGVGSGQISLSGNDVVYSGSLVIGSFTGGSGSDDLVITLNGNASVFSVTALLGAIGYSNTNLANPDTGTRTVGITVTDGDGGTSQVQTVTVGVTAVNDAPTLDNPIANQTVQAGQTLTYEVPADTFADVDSGTLHYTATLANGGALPAWLLFDAATRTFVGNPSAANVGTLQVMIVADDGALTAADTFDIVVSAPPVPPGPANNAPTSVSLSNGSVAENSAANTPVGTVSGTDPDQGDVLRFSLVDNPGNQFKIVDGQLLVADGATLDFETQSSYQITIRATDAAGASKDQIFTIDITDIAEGPDDGGGQVIRGDRFDNKLKGGDGDDLIYGYRGDDRLQGGAGDDGLEGGRGNDRLSGGNGDDVLEGGRGNDLLRGGGGADTFVFGAYGGRGFGHDRIDDFNPDDGDRIVLTGIDGFTGFEDLVDNHVTEKGANLLITADDGSTILLRGIGIADLGSDSFVF